MEHVYTKKKCKTVMSVASATTKCKVKELHLELITLLY